MTVIRQLLMGGSFDPVHDGHVLWAERIRLAAGADQLTLLPCADPVHRAALNASFAQRLDMLALALRDYPALMLDPLEQSLPAPTFTAQTLRALHARNGGQPKRAFAWCMGADSYWSLPQWREPAAVRAQCCFVVVRRAESNTLAPFVSAVPDWLQAMWQRRQPLTATNLAAAQNGDVLELVADELPFSASAIRAAIKSGEQCPAGLNPALAAYIRAAGLYQ